MLGEFMGTRKPTLEEIGLIRVLISKANELVVPDNWEEKVLVKNMDDGEMGGLNLYVDHNGSDDKVLGGTVSELQFDDEDGVKVLASLNVDSLGAVFELDIWKTNYEPLMKIPRSFDL